MEKGNYKEAIDTYRQSVLAEAEEYVEKDDYLTAVTLLNAALGVIENNTSIQTQISLYVDEQRLC